MSLEVVSDQLAYMGLNHRRAIEIITEYQRSGSPYVLMLRTFDEVLERRVDAEDASAGLRRLSAQKRGPIAFRIQHGRVWLRKNLLPP